MNKHVQMNENAVQQLHCNDDHYDEKNHVHPFEPEETGTKTRTKEN